MTTRAEDLLREKYGWRKVEAPQPWRPLLPGDELIGFYGGMTKRTGMHGEYSVVIVHVPQAGSRTCTGSALIRLVDAGMVARGCPIRIIYQGLRTTGNGFNEKQYDLLIATGPAVAVEALPELSQ
jgi:hypothetical protein